MLFTIIIHFFIIKQGSISTVFLNVHKQINRNYKQVYKQELSMIQNQLMYKKNAKKMKIFRNKVLKLDPGCHFFVDSGESGRGGLRSNPD